MFQQSTEQIFSVFGLPGTYESEEDFEAKDITVLVNSYGKDSENNPEVQINTAEVDVMVSEVPNPQIGSTIVFDSVQYQLSEVLYGDGYTWTLSLAQGLI